MGTKKTGQLKSLAAGRPPVLQRPKSITRKVTKALINKHHLLEKRKRQASAKGDTVGEAAIDAEIQSLGGLERYQQASLQGQRDDRGGDSSRVLMEWLEPCLPELKSDSSMRLRMLEVGALSVRRPPSNLYLSNCHPVQEPWHILLPLDTNSYLLDSECLLTQWLF